MLCPHCNVDLAMTERQGVEIDYCPRCRGVWLDRGELDKIIERVAGLGGPSPAPPPPPAAEPWAPPRPAMGQQHPVPGYDDRHLHYRKHKKKSFLGDLFDFD